MGSLKPTIEPFDSGSSYILDLPSKLISLLVICSYNCNNATKKKVVHLGSSIAQVSQSILNVIPQWISKPRIRRPYKHLKTSSVAGRFAQSLRTCKNQITMYKTVNLEDTINATLSNVTDHNTSPFLPTFHIMV